MAIPASRWLVLAAAVVLVFGATVAIALQVVPGPHSDTDYLVIGSVATLLSLAAVFLVLMLSTPKHARPLLKRRPISQDPPAPEPSSQSPLGP
jgi:uncharacterized membrane protein YccC